MSYQQAINRKRISSETSNDMEKHICKQELPSFEFLGVGETALELKLKHWCVTHGIRKKACDDILEIMREEGLQAPNCYEELFQQNKRSKPDAEFLQQKLTETCNQLSSMKSMLEKQEEILATHTALMNKIADTVFPQDDLKIFPFKSIDEILTIEETLDTLPESKLWSYIRSVIGGSAIESAFSRMFTEETVMKINWDGSHSKFGLRKTQLFPKHVYGATRKQYDSFEDFEIAMRSGFRRYKNRQYKKTCKLKAEESAASREESLE